MRLLSCCNRYSGRLHQWTSEEVATSGIPIVITKRGRPVARLEPLEAARPASLEGSVVRERDLVSPIDEDWDTTA